MCPLRGLLLAGILALPGTVTRAGEVQPAFDCGKAEGTVQALICRDDELAMLDLALADVYAAARARARDGLGAELEAIQRGWVRGRDECWKAEKVPTWLTASWQVTGVRACVAGQYRLRISELQAVWRLVPAPSVTGYDCSGAAGVPAGELVATHFGTDPPTARLERGDQVATVWNIPTASGAKYEGQNVVYWTRGGEATVEWLGENLTCRARAVDD